MRLRARGIFWVVVVGGLLAAVLVGAYRFWPVFTFEDGPFFSEPFVGPVDSLPIYSSVQLHRLGRYAYSLEARDLGTEPPATVLVLRSRSGAVLWQRSPCHDATLGRLRFQRAAQLTWWGGWAIPIDPEYQEVGVLYLGPRGGFKNYFHSW